MNMKHKIAVTLLIAGPLIVAAGFNLILGISGGVIALGIIAIFYGAFLISP